MNLLMFYKVSWLDCQVIDVKSTVPSPGAFKNAMTAILPLSMTSKLLDGDCIEARAFNWQEKIPP